MAGVLQRRRDWAWDCVWKQPPFAGEGAAAGADCGAAGKKSEVAGAETGVGERGKRRKRRRKRKGRRRRKRRRAAIRGF